MLAAQHLLAVLCALLELTVSWALPLQRLQPSRRNVIEGLLGSSALHLGVPVADAVEPDVTATPAVTKRVFFDLRIIERFDVEVSSA